MNMLFTFLLGLSLGWLLSQRLNDGTEENTMPTDNQQETAIPACDWCRAAMHHKCVNKTRVTGVCACDCERGY